VRQATFFCKEIDVFDARYDVNKDVMDDRLMNVLDSSPEEKADKVLLLMMRLLWMMGSWWWKWMRIRLFRIMFRF